MAVIGCALLSCKAEPLSSDIISSYSARLTIAKNQTPDLENIGYDYSVFSLRSISREIFELNSGHIASSENEYTFEDVPYGTYDVTISAYLNDVIDPVYVRTESIEVSEKTVMPDGSQKQSVTVSSDDIVYDSTKTDSSSGDGGNGTDGTFDDGLLTGGSSSWGNGIDSDLESRFSVVFFDADGKTNVSLGSDGFYTFSMVDGPEGHTVNVAVAPVDSSSASEYTCTWSIGYSSSGYDDPVTVSAIKMSEYAKTNGSTDEIRGYAESASGNVKNYSFLYLRDEKDRENPKGYLLRLTIKSGSDEYSKDFKILCINDPYSPLVYLSVGDMSSAELTDSVTASKMDVNFMKYHNKTGGRSSNQSKTAWLFFIDASHDLCYYLDNFNDFVNYSKYQACSDMSRFGFEWGYNDEYPIRSNIEATSSKDMNQYIMYRKWSNGGIVYVPDGNVFTASAGSKNKIIWNALAEFRERYAAGKDRYSIPNHRALMYAKRSMLRYLNSNNLTAAGLEYFNISTEKCSWYWTCDQHNYNQNGSAGVIYDHEIGEYAIAQCPDYTDYARAYSFNDSDDNNGVNLRAISKENIYTRARLVLELPVFDIIGTDVLK